MEKEKYIQDADAWIDDSGTKFLQYPSMGCNIKWVKGNEPEYE